MKRETRIGSFTGSLRLEGGNLRYEREGDSFEADVSIVAMEPGCWSVLLNDESYRVTLSATGELAVNGIAMPVEVFDPRSLRSASGSALSQGKQTVCAPMPGKVVRILVAQGDVVEAGQGLVVVEAMKMQNEMKSPKAGTVVELKTRVDAAVTAGDILVVVE
jgi:biotin carboxyl carrier protein